MTHPDKFKVYINKEEKIKDFIIGFFYGVSFAVVPIIGWALGIFFLYSYYDLFRWRFYGVMFGFPLFILLDIYVMINFNWA